MRQNYDFSKSIANPYVKRLKQQVTIRLDRDSVAYFKRLAAETGLSYQVLIDLYLKDCVARGQRPSPKWVA